MKRPRPRAASAALAVEAKQAPTATDKPREVKVSDYIVAQSAVAPEVARPPVQPFALPAFPPGVEPEKKLLQIAQDEGLSEASQWAGAAYHGLNLTDGLAWLGFPLLAELAQRPEYRKIARTIAEESTRKWIKFEAASNKDKGCRLKELDAEFRRLRVREHFRKAGEMDAFMGRHHLFLDLGAGTRSLELQTSIGDGHEPASRNKVAKGSLKALRSIEAMWAYPSGYNTTDPLSEGWYCPTTWYVMSQPVHGTRLLTFVSCEVPDLLKASYAFGGVSMSQQAKPYIDNWLRTRQGVSDLIDSFSDKGIKIDLAAALANGSLQNVLNRIALFANIRNNRGVMAIDKDEEFFNVETGLGSLDKLQAQSLEQVAMIPGIPLVKLLGLQPAGLSGSSDGDIRVFYDAIHAYQDITYRPNLDRLLPIVQLSLWGEVDPDITYSFNPLWSLDDKDLANIEQVRAETDKSLIEARVISRGEARSRVANAAASPYPGLNPDEVPAPSIADATDMAVKKATVFLQAAEIPDVPPADVLRGLRDTGLFPRITEAAISAVEAQRAEAPPVGESDVSDDGRHPSELASAEDIAALGADAEWKEGDHPRGEGGKFGSGSTAHVVASHHPETGNIVIHGVHAQRDHAVKHQVGTLQKQYAGLDRKYDLASHGHEDRYQGGVHAQRTLGAFKQPYAQAKGIEVKGSGDGSGGLHIVAEGHQDGGLTVHGAYHDPKEAGAHAERLSREAWAEKGEARSEITDREVSAARRAFNEGKPAHERVSREQSDDQTHAAFEKFLEDRHPMDEVLPHSGVKQANRYLVENSDPDGAGRSGVIRVLHHKPAA